ncbi:RagB/SusD family nutrient uptake outer membrane protein [Chryseobacterium sp. NEB161]|nr:RagB/SusD family nutrient uptake outer membrane protein [Chryseobacterium sp. NEB161]
MHNYFYKIRTGLIIILSFYLVLGCEDFLEIGEPKNQISQSSIFRNKETALAALADVYTGLRSKGILCGDPSGISVLLGNYSDELQSLTTQQADFRSFYELGVQSSSSAVASLWSNAYQQIYEVNNIIEGVQLNRNYLDSSTANQLLGEAYFIRGLLHFYLTNIFGDIPYVVSTDYNINKNIYKTDNKEVYALAMKDLVLAESLLPLDYPTASRTRANKSAAQLVMARINLYQKNWSAAKLYVSKVLANSAYTLVQDLDAVFLKDSKSAILQWFPADTGANTLEGQYFIFLSLPPSNFALTDSFLNSFENGDLRKSQWIKKLSNSQLSYSHPYKYKQNNKTAVSQEYSMVLRVEEAYLIAAEAENELGNLSQAKVFLNKIRSRAGLPDDTSMSVEEMRDHI